MWILWHEKISHFECNQFISGIIQLFSSSFQTNCQALTLPCDLFLVLHYNIADWWRAIYSTHIIWTTSIWLINQHFLLKLSWLGNVDFFLLERGAWSKCFKRKWEWLLIKKKKKKAGSLFKKSSNNLKRKENV